MSTQKKLNKVFKQVSREFNLPVELVEECFDINIKLTKDKLTHPFYDSVELFGFGAFKITRYTLHKTLKGYIKELRKLHKRRWKQYKVIEEYENQFREIWTLKQNLINERRSKGLPHHAKKRCV